MKRGYYRHHIVLRLADEGIPVSAIARVLQKPPATIGKFLRDEHLRGHLRKMPAWDWPADSRRETRTPAAPSIDRALIEGDSIAIERLGFTITEGRLLAALLMVGHALKPTLLTAIGSAPEVSIKNIDVHVCKIRKKLTARGVEIGTLWGRGYRLTPENQARLRALMSERSDLGRPIEEAHVAAA